jgi:hypothetical protein
MAALYPALTRTPGERQLARAYHNFRIWFIPKVPWYSPESLPQTQHGMSRILSTRLSHPALSRVPSVLAPSSSSLAAVATTTTTIYVPSGTRSISSSPYGRTHVWKRRPKKLPNPVVPQFPQRVIRADGSSFTHWTTSPRSLTRLTRDVTNHPLWNISVLTGEGVVDAEMMGRLGRFNRKFVEEVDWMSEAEGTSAAPPATTQGPKKTGGASKKQ